MDSEEGGGGAGEEDAGLVDGVVSRVESTVVAEGGEERGKRRVGETD